jgi:hypothetical protein
MCLLTKKNINLPASRNLSRFLSSPAPLKGLYFISPFFRSHGTYENQRFRGPVLHEVVRRGVLQQRCILKLGLRAQEARLAGWHRLHV